MFISSYNTYLSNTTTHTKKTQSEQKEFRFKKEASPVSTSHTDTKQPKLPVSYISRFKVLQNQQKLHEQVQAGKKSKFTKVALFKNAQSAYSENSAMFPLFKKPKISLGEKPTTLPKVNVSKQNAVNTYIANENYYRVTA